MTPNDKWQYVCDKLKDLDNRLKKLEGYADSRIKNKQGGEAQKMYDPNAPDPPRPPLDKPET